MSGRLLSKLKMDSRVATYALWFFECSKYPHEVNESSTMTFYWKIFGIFSSTISERTDHLCRIWETLEASCKH